MKAGFSLYFSGVYFGIIVQGARFTLSGRLMRSFWLLGLLLVFGTAPTSRAQAPDTLTATAVPAPVPPAPRVIEVRGRLELGQVVDVRMEGLAAWAAAGDPGKLIPYLNGRGVRGLYPEAIYAAENRLKFHLRRDDASREAWLDLLRDPVLVRPVTFSVGPEGVGPFVSVYDQDNHLPLVVIPTFEGIVAFLMVMVSLFFFVQLARRTSIIRDTGPRPLPGQKRPYSLARAQMAFWFFLVLSAYLCIWLVTEDLDSITPSTLVLLGISSGTALGAVMVVQSKRNAKDTRQQALAAEKETLTTRLTELRAQAGANGGAAPVAPTVAQQAAVAEMVQAQRRLAEVNLALAAQTKATGPRASTGFLTDLLSGPEGYSFHRFQIFVWTLVLGFIFLVSVYQNLMMPEFSATLLALMGISSGTYLGFQFPAEN